MAILYVWSGAVGSATGADWANAKTTLTAAFVTEAAGDTLFVAHDHAESTAAAITLTSSGTVGNPTKIICVDRGGTVPPVSADRRTTGQVSTTTGAINFVGFAHYDGIIFTSGVGVSSTAHIILPSVASGSLRFDNCSLRVATTFGTSKLFVGGNTGTAYGSHNEFNNTTVSFANAAHGIAIAGTLRWRNTPSATLGSIPTTLFISTTTAGGEVECIGVDLSAVNTTIVGAIPATSTATRFRFIDCKLHASATKSAVPAVHGSGEVDFIRTGATGVNYTVHRHRTAGLLVEEVTVVRTGGASDGVTPIAWAITTTANCNYSLSYECPPIAIWNDTTGSAVTATVEGAWNGASVPLDNEIFLECEFLGDASSPQGSFVNDGMVDLLATPANQTSSASTWAMATLATYNGVPSANVVMSNGNRTVTHGSATSAMGVNSLAVASTGKYYFEVAVEVSTSSSNGFGIAPSSISAFASPGSGINGGVGVSLGSGSSYVWSDGGQQVTTNFGPTAVGNIFGAAIDLTARLAWFRKGSGNWNMDAGADPATGTGGVAITTGSLAPYIYFASGGTTDVMTGNFGQAAFANAAPSGFGNWPGGAPFKMAVTFTPQQKGWIYARVKCAKASSIFYLDPLVTLS